MASVLIVDDDEDLCEILADVLRGLGHDVRTGHNGAQGLGALDDALPDLILLDIEMPVLDGPGMAHEMFIQDAGKEKIPIVLLSGFVDLPAIAARVGTPFFAAKPARLDTVLSLIERALRERTRILVPPLSAPPIAARLAS